MFMEESKQHSNYSLLASDQHLDNLLTTERIKMLGSAHIQKLLLGSGRFQKVFRVDLEDGKSYAVK